MLTINILGAHSDLCSLLQESLLALISANQTGKSVQILTGSPEAADYVIWIDQGTDEVEPVDYDFRITDPQFAANISLHAALIAQQWTEVAALLERRYWPQPEPQFDNPHIDDHEH